MTDKKHEIVYRYVTDLIPYANNSRSHSEHHINQIASSIKEFGFTNPVLIDGDNGIIAGHGRTQAAYQIGMESVPCIVLDHLTDAQRRAYIIADNQLALASEWNMDNLQNEVQRLTDENNFDLELLGFNQDELLDLQFDPGDFKPGDEDDQGDLDELEPKYVTCPHCEQIFDAREHEG